MFGSRNGRPVVVVTDLQQEAGWRTVGFHPVPITMANNHGTCLLLGHRGEKSDLLLCIQIHHA